MVEKNIKILKKMSSGKLTSLESMLIIKNTIIVPYLIVIWWIHVQLINIFYNITIFMKKHYKIFAQIHTVINGKMTISGARSAVTVYLWINLEFSVNFSSYFNITTNKLQNRFTNL